MSGSGAKAFHIFADQIRLLNGQVSSMRKDWSDENQQTKDRVSRLATEVATQSDADRMRMIVQRFAGEIVPDSKAIVRHAIDEQAEIVDQRINFLSSEIRESVKDSEIPTGQLRQVIQENHQAIRRSHAASKDEILKDLDKLEGRIFSVEKTVGLRTPAGDLTMLGPDRATSSGTDANFRELNLKLKKLYVEHDKLAKWVTESVGGLHEELIGPAGSIPCKTGKCQHGRECRFEHDKSPRNPAAPSTPRPVIGPLGTSLCTSGTATTGCVASAQLSNASTCIRSRLRVRSLSRLAPLPALLLRMKRGRPLGHLRPVLPIGRQGVSTAPLKD